MIKKLAYSPGYLRVVEPQPAQKQALNTAVDMCKYEFLEGINLRIGLLGSMSTEKYLPLK